MKIDDWCYYAPNFELRIKATAIPYEARIVDEALRDYGACYVSARLLAMILGGASPYNIDRVIFNPPATIVFWRDGIKTVVKAENEPFDAEKGFAMAVAKKFLTSKDYHRIMAAAKDYRESVCADNAGQTRRKDE